MTENDIRILSAGAPKTAVSLCAEAFNHETGISVSYEFATAPMLKEAVATGTCSDDILVAPKAVVEAFEASGEVVSGSSAIVGSVKAAVTIKSGAFEPDLSSADALKQALLDTNSVVYNEASSGQYIATMIEKMGISGQIADKVTITKTGSEVMQHLDKSDLTNEIGFGQATEIQVQIDKGCDVKLLGTLPKEVEKISTYSAVLLTGSADNKKAQDLINFIGSEAGQEICRSTGLI